MGDGDRRWRKRRLAANGFAQTGWGFRRDRGEGALGCARATNRCDAAILLYVVLLLLCCCKYFLLHYCDAVILLYCDTAVLLRCGTACCTTALLYRGIAVLRYCYAAALQQILLVPGAVLDVLVVLDRICHTNLALRLRPSSPIALYVWELEVSTKRHHFPRVSVVVFLLMGLNGPFLVTEDATSLRTG